MSTITGTAGSDILFGTQFDDVIDTGGGVDQVYAGGGDDVVRLTGQVPLAVQVAGQIDGGTGHDILDLTDWHGAVSGGNFFTTDGGSELALLTVSADRTRVNYVAYATGFEEVHLGPDVEGFSFYLESDANPATLQGWTIVGSAADDHISDSRGYDHISTGVGNDEVRFNGGSDVVSLGDGDDLFQIDRTSGFQDHATLDGGAGSDTMRVADQGLAAYINLDMRTGVGAIGTTAFDLINMDNASVESVWYPGLVRDVLLGGNDGANLLRVTGDAATVLVGRGGDDTLDGAQVSSGLTAFGGSGADQVYGGSGGDWINGGGHYSRDDATVDTAADGGDYIDAGAGNDHVYGNSQFAAQGSVDGADIIHAGDGMDYVNGNAGNDSIYGEAGPDRLYGGAGDDGIYGGAGNDHINGNKGNDLLGGGDGNDQILGGQGDDTISGGDGIDTLTGNAGNDTFFLAASGAFTTSGPLGNRTDVITDFEDGHDELDIHNFLTAIVRPGAAADFTGALAMARAGLANATSHDLALVQVGADTYLFYDVYNHDPQSAVLLLNVSASAIDSFDFIF